MMKVEFEKIVGTKVNDSDYKIIEKVYTWHPALLNTTGKQQIAELYKIGGMPLIRDMLETAEFMESLDNEERTIKAMLHSIVSRKKEVESGNLQYERCRKALKNAFDSSDSDTELERMIKLMSHLYDANLIMEIRNELKI